MLILYAGSDAYRLRLATQALVASYREKYGSIVNLFRIDGSDEDAAEHIERQLKYPSFFDEKKIIVVQDAAGQAVSDILKRYTLSDLDDIVFIAVQLTTHESCDKKVLATLGKKADRTEVFEPLAGAQLAVWARQYCSEQNTSIEPDALSGLLQRTGTDMQQLSCELEKLCAFVRGGVITPGDVRLLTPVREEQDEWELSNALSAHDKRAIIGVLWKQLQTGVAEQKLLGSLASGIRNLSMVKDMQVRGKPVGATAATTGLHPFVISKTMRGAAAADTGKLRRAHIGLAELDRSYKDGRADIVDGLFAILLSL